MEFREVSTFLEVAQLRSFSRAAEKLGYSQAAVTIQVKHLETELGARLFDRIGKQVTLTHQGVIFMEHANRLVTDMALARTALSEPSELTGRLCIGTIESICASIFPGLLKEFHRLYPKVSVSIVTDSPDKLLDMMNRNALDIVYFLDKKMYDTKWIKALEVPDQVIFVTGSGAPFANASLPLEEMIRQPFILTEKDASYRFLLERYLASENLEIHPFLEIGSTEFIVRLLGDSQAVSFLPEFTVRQGIEDGLLAPVHVPGFHMRIWKQIVYHKDKWVSREMEAFLLLAGQAE